MTPEQRAYEFVEDIRSSCWTRGEPEWRYRQVYRWVLAQFRRSS